MAQNNQISATITPEDKQQVLTNINQAKALLQNALQFNLQPEDRQEMIKMGDKTLAFAQKALDYAAANANMVPAFLNLSEAQQDYALSRDLYEIYQTVNAFTRSLEDAMMVSGSETYQAALIFYNSVKGAVKSNVAGSQAIYDDLKSRFPGRPAKRQP